MPQIVNRKINLATKNKAINLPVPWLRWLRDEYGEDAVVQLKLTVTDKIVIEPIPNGKKVVEAKKVLLKRRRRS